MKEQKKKINEMGNLLARNVNKLVNLCFRILLMAILKYRREICLNECVIWRISYMWISMVFLMVSTSSSIYGWVTASKQQLITILCRRHDLQTPSDSSQESLLCLPATLRIRNKLMGDVYENFSYVSGTADEWKTLGWDRTLWVEKSH